VIFLKTTFCIDNFGTDLVNTGTGTSYAIDETGIAWESDVKNKFKAPPNANTIQWTDSTNGNI